MTKQERNTYIILGAVGVGAFYLINKQNQERQRREAIRLQQLQAKQNRGGGLGNLIGSIGDLIQKRRERKAMKGTPMKGDGGFTMPDLDISGFNANATTTQGIATNLGLDPNDPFGVGSFNVPDLPDFNFDNP